jgi:hypothetical protein
MSGRDYLSDVCRRRDTIWDYRQSSTRCTDTTSVTGRPEVGSGRSLKLHLELAADCARNQGRRSVTLSVYTNRTLTEEATWNDGRQGNYRNRSETRALAQLAQGISHILEHAP